MRKFFLIPVLALFTCVSMWGATVPVSTYAELKSAVATANDGDVIELTADINYGKLGYANNLNITKSITLDGKGHTLTGAAQRESSQTAQYATVWVNIGGADSVAVVFKDIKIINNNKGATGKDFVIHTRGKLKSITLENVELDATACAANATCLQIGGNHYNTINLAINDCKFVAGASSYAFSTWNTIKLETRNTKYSGYCAMYFHQNSSYTGTKETRVDADACDFDAPNVHSGKTNAFGVFAAFSENIKLYLHNCGMNAQARGTALQAMLTSDSYNHNPGHYMEITGDNSHINGDFTLNFSPYGYDRIEIMGGTYSVDPSNYKVYANSNVFANFVPEGYEVLEVKQGDITLYRVVKKATTKTVGEDEVLYNLNELVVGEGVSEGVNPTSSFAVIDSIVLANNTTQAGYVAVGDTTTTGTMDSITVTVPENKTFVIKNGLDVKENAKVVAEPQSTIVIGEGGIITDNEESIIIEANENGGASLLLHPSITVNQTPELTIHMVVPAEHAGYEMNGSDKYRHWHRFAMPVEHMDATWVKNPNVATYLYGWDYSAQVWAQVGVTEMVPFAGYTLSPDRLITNETGAITYIFKGKLLGNTNCTLNLNHHGYNFFGNSYTGYISILKLVDQIMGDAKIDGTVWMWDGEKYEGIGLEYLRQYENVPGMIESWQKEVAPMQTFVLRLTGSELSSTDINYADAIWGNPRYENATAVATPSAAPTRHTQINDNAIISLSIAANGQKESIVLLENDDYSDAYDRGYDAVKYMNDNSFNSYVGVNGENYSTVATDNLEGKMLSINTNNELAYTMTFDFVAGEEYAIRDNVTGKVIAIEEGASYEFAAQPNSTVEGRFEIVAVAKMPTAIENTEVKANVKGIYTIMGQYLGEDFDILPAGVYVVNGVKIVK